MFRRLDIAIQRIVLVGGYWLIRAFRFGRARDISWVVGTTEIASMVIQLADAIPRSHSVSFAAHPYYARRYDSESYRAPASLGGRFDRTIGRPLLLARLMNRSSGFIFVGLSGFLRGANDEREFEFRFITKRGLKLCCYFTGTDIRSPQLMVELAARTGVENLGTRLAALNEKFTTPAYEAEKKRIACVADAYADVIFSCSVDQLSYLEKPTEPFLYFQPDERIVDTFEKFDAAQPTVVVHAPSRPLLKGTPLVREAVERLRTEGYVFEYVELIDVSNETVLEHLARAHIVLNQFYGFVPGVFGVEAMAAGAAVMMSADERVEPDLPVGSNTAWCVTAPADVYGNLKRLLDDRELCRELGVAGAAWVREHASRSAGSERLLRTLDATSAGS